MTVVAAAAAEYKETCNCILIVSGHKTTVRPPSTARPTADDDPVINCTVQFQIAIIGGPRALIRFSIGIVFCCP